MSLVNLVPKMTSATTPSGVASASSEDANYSGWAWRAFNRTNTPYVHGSTDVDCWHVTLGVEPIGQWLEYEFDSPQDITDYYLEPFNYYGDTLNNGYKRMVRDWDILGQTKDGVWNTIDSRSGETFQPVTGKFFKISSPGTYSKYRILVKQTNGAIPRYCCIGKFELLANEKGFLILDGSGTAHTTTSGEWSSVGAVPTDANDRKNFFISHSKESFSETELSSLGGYLPGGTGKIVCHIL